NNLFLLTFSDPVSRFPPAATSVTLHISMRYHILLLLVAAAAFAQTTKPVADRVAAQNALFDEQYETDLRNFPERATSFGDYRYNDKLADHSLDAIAQNHKTDESFLARLNAIPTSGF